MGNAPYACSVDGTCPKSIFEDLQVEDTRPTSPAPVNILHSVKIKSARPGAASLLVHSQNFDSDPPTDLSRSDSHTKDVYPPTSKPPLPSTEIRDRYAKDLEQYYANHPPTFQWSGIGLPRLQSWSWLQANADVNGLEQLGDATDGGTLECTWQVPVRQEPAIDRCDDVVDLPCVPSGDSANDAGVSVVHDVQLQSAGQGGELEEVFLVHDVQLQSGTLGIQYRWAPSMESRSSYLAPFGSAVVGIAHAGEWLKVGEAEFLPMAIQGRQVLTPLAVDELRYRNPSPGVKRLIGEVCLVKDLDGQRRRVNVVGANIDGTLNVIDNSESLVRTDLCVQDVMRELSRTWSEVSV